jgi:nitrogen fixation/metabolism regulation signal transduction histidine kinase
MNLLFQAHSGLRYLVLLAGLVALAYFVSGLVTKRPVGKGVRVLGAIFAGLLDLQMLLGLIMVAMGRYYPRLIGHIVTMVLAIAVTHALLSINRKRPNPGYLLPLIAVAAALVLIVGGIMAIGRGVLTHTSLGG